MAATTAIITSGKTRVRPRGGMTKKRALDWLLLAAVIVGALIVLVPFYLILVDRTSHPLDRLVARWRPYDKLGDERIVIDGDGPTFVDAAVIPNPGTCGCFEELNLSRRRKEVILRVLGIDPAFDRRAFHRHILLPERDREACRNLDLLLDKVDAGDHFGDRVFHLKACVHFEEIELQVLIHEELDCSCVDVVGRLRHLQSRFTHAPSQICIDDGRGTLFDNLLVPSLDTALALPKENGVPVAVCDFLILRAVRESNGFAVAVDDDAILAARDEVALREGFLMCPEGAATYAAWKQEVAGGRISPDESAVLFNCASGLKYPLPPADQRLDRTRPIDYSRLAD